MIWRWLYSLAWYLGLPLAFAYLLKRSRKQVQYRQHWGERLGFYPPASGSPLIWLHAVSVGETRALAPLLTAIRQRYPNHQILLTQMTPTGRESARELYGDQVQLAYLPYDLPGAVARFYRHFQPQFGLLMEMEIWPNLLHGAAKVGMPIYLVNARLSEKSARGYRKVAPLIIPALACLAGVAAQSEQDAARLGELGAARIRVCGNIKYELVFDPQAQAKGCGWRASFGPRAVWAAACTRDGEETLLLDGLHHCGLLEHSLLLLIPRHPQRFDEVAALLQARGLRFIRRSQWQGEALDVGVQVVLGDSLGELSAYYAACDVALVGGSLLPFGCHSVIEPAMLGVPVVIGPSSYNFALAVEEAQRYGALRQCQTVEQCLSELASLLQDSHQRQIMGKAAEQFIRQHQGAVQRVLALLPD